jgi:general stress protein YciG
MAGTKIGGAKARETNCAKHGRDFYARIGSMGGSKTGTKPKGFAANPELASRAGTIGGRKSRRGKAPRDENGKIMHSKDYVAKRETEKEETKQRGGWRWLFSGRKGK